MLQYTSGKYKYFASDFHVLRIEKNYECKVTDVFILKLKIIV